MLSKQENNEILLYFKDGSTRMFTEEDIGSIKIIQSESGRTIGLAWTMLASTLIAVAIIGLSRATWY